jgi:hypothetical protein
VHSKVPTFYHSFLKQHPNLKPVASLLLALSLRYLSAVSELIPSTTPMSLQRHHLEAGKRLDVQLLGVMPRAVESYFLYDPVRHDSCLPHEVNTEPRKQQRSELVTALTTCT